jgi:hypothetical protein
VLTWWYACDAKTPARHRLALGTIGFEGRFDYAAIGIQCRLAALRRGAAFVQREHALLYAIFCSRGDRHISAEMLFEEARSTNASVSLATVWSLVDARLTTDAVAVDGLAEPAVARSV